MRHIHTSYLFIFLAMAILAGMSYRVVDWTVAVMGCRHIDTPGTFLAYCASPQFSYYEHGAYYYGLEPEAIDKLKRSEVIFLGTSHEQFAFSTDAVDRYFGARKIPFYLFGFSFGEPAEFALALFRKIHPAPKMLVIVADPYFSAGSLSPVSKLLVLSDQSIWRRTRLWRDYFMKKMFGRVQSGICSWIPKACSEKIASFYRRADNGSWIWRDILYPPSAFPFQSPTSLPALPAAGASASLAFARQFLKTSGVSADCVVLTATPTNTLNSQPFAKELAAQLGAHAIFPQLTGLAGVDAGHLNWESAQRWSDAFLREMDPIVKRCVSGKTPP